MFGATTVNLVQFTRGRHHDSDVRLERPRRSRADRNQLPIDGGDDRHDRPRYGSRRACDSYEDVDGELAAHLIGGLGIRSEVGAPVVVEGRCGGR